MTTPFLAFMPHGLDFVWILLALLLFFGPKKLPELARGIGRSLGEFKKAKSDFDHELKESLKETPPAVVMNPSSVSVDPMAAVAHQSLGAPGAAGTPTGALPATPVEPKKEDGTGPKV